MLRFTFPVKTKESYKLGIFMHVFSVYFVKKKQADITHRDKTKEADGDISVNVDCSYFFQRDAVLEHAVLLVLNTYLTKPKPY